MIDDKNSTGEALMQLLERDYAAKYRNSKTEAVHIGIKFSKRKRQVVGLEVL
ncbi:MAG: PD-(D/E)XK nuclease domain-containing protein [Dissulfuribacterales bacterium]